MQNSKYFAAFVLAGGLTFGATSQSIAAPAVPNITVAKAATSDVVDVQWGWRRGWGWRGGWGPGLGIGLGLGFAGAALASPYYSGCGYGPCGYGSGPAYGYGPGYVYAPGYAYAPAVAVGPGYYGWGWRRPYWRRSWW